MRQLGLLGFCVLVVASCGKGSPANHGGQTPGGAPEAAAGGEGPSGLAGAESALGGLGGASDATPGDGGMSTAGDSAGGEPGFPPGGAVSGVVLRGHEPVVGVTVVLDDAMTTTKADGTFSFASAPLLYRLSVISVGSKAAYVFDGMSQRKPQIQFGYGFADQRSASLKGALSKSAAGTAAGQTQVAYFSMAQGLLGSKAVAGDASSFTFDAYWVGPVAQQGKLVALATEPGNAGARNFVGFGEKTLSIETGAKVGEDAGTLGAADVTLAAVAGQHQVSGKVTVPAGYTLQPGSLDLGPISFPITANGAGAFSCDVPEIPGLKAALRFSALKFSKPSVTSTLSVAVPASGAALIAIPEGSTQVSPATGATGVTFETQFSWKPAKEGLVTNVRFTLGAWHVWRITTASFTTLPELQAYGVDVPPSTTSYWIVGGIGWANSVDAAAALMNPYSGLAEADYVSTSTDDFAFTTAP